jgi:uncharacterized protein Yka (UPF0111/DUF47 family)
MIFGEKPAVVSGKSSFNDVVEKACERLMERQIKYSIQRIQTMEDRLDQLERELDEFLFHKIGK